MTTHAHGSRPRPHWRQFAVNIISPAILTFALFFSLIFAVLIPTMKRNIIDRKKEMIRELTQVAWSELAGLQEQEARGALSRAAAQQAAIDRIRHLRYGENGKDYFWITDTQTHMVMHPYRPELNGKDLSDYTDPSGKKLFAEHTKVVQEEGAGYVEYLWQWNDDDQRVAPKLSFVKGFAPWGWIVGTGVYLGDVQAEISRMIQRTLQISVGISVVIAALLVYISQQALKLERHRWRTETALRGSEEKYRLLAEGTTEGVLLVLQDRPVYANKSLLDRLGHTAEELARLPLEEIVTSVSAGGPPNPIAERRAKVIHKTGEVSDVLLSTAPITVGDKTGQILTLKDVAARRKTEETLARLVADLQSMLPLATRTIKASPLTLTTCDPDTPIHQAAAAMAAAGSSAILVQSPAGEPLGIVTDQDLRTRVLAAGLSPAQPVAAIMSAPLVCISDRAMLFEAARVMEERNVQHLVVTNARGALVGILTGTEVLHAQHHAIRALLSEIQEAPSPEALRHTHAKLPVFIKALLESGARVDSVTRIMTTVSDAILVRLIALGETELGPPPARYSFVVMGSEAREEQTLATDQDNALIYADVAPEQAEAAQSYFLQLAARVCGWLAFIGYRRCPGDVMASNRKWCRPLAQWRQYFADCVTAGTPQDLLDLNVFFDLRCVYGEPGHVLQLREHLHALLEGEGRDAFFFHLAQSTLQFKAPRGFFGNIQFESSPDHPAAFNVKTAIVPLANFARIYALRNRFAETNTLERFHLLRDHELLLPSSHDELTQAYTALMQMRLTHQAAQISRGTEPDNLVDLQELTQLERSMLKKIFADIAVFQARLRTDFARTA